MIYTYRCRFVQVVQIKIEYYHKYSFRTEREERGEKRRGEEESEERDEDYSRHHVLFFFALRKLNLIATFSTIQNIKCTNLDKSGHLLDNT